MEVYENVFTDEEEEAMVEECWKRAEDRQNAIPLGLVILFHTGLRIGELCALQWKHIDLAQNCLYVRQILKPKIIIKGLSTQSDGYEVSEFAKTQKSRRTVVYSNDTVDVFREIERYNIANGYGVEDEDYVFRRGENIHADTTADLCNDRVFDDRLRKWCKYLDFPYAKSPHDIRRTFASKCFENGLDATDIQMLLGHEELSTTLSYIKNRKAHKTMVEKMNRVFKCA